MNKIWFFGDSFAHPPHIKDLKNEENSYWWGTKLCEKYNYVPRVMSEPGSSILYMQEQLLRFKNLILKDDIVFIFYSTPYRFDFGKNTVSLVSSGLTSTGKLMPTIDNNTLLGDERLQKILNMYVALGLDLDKHLIQQYSTVNYIQHVLVPEIKKLNNTSKIIEFYSFRKSQLCHSLLVKDNETTLKDLPEAMEWIKLKCKEKNLDVDEIFADPSHFGNPTVGNLNEEFLNYIESLL
tara:strand:+ start:432 stop:1142 length:711 start_codon:yes stop_codon:yes gene_type:complete